MRILPDFWQRRFLFYEAALVAVVGAVGVVYGYRCGGNHVIDSLIGDDRERIYAVLAPMFASLFGFVIAATSIIVALADRPRFAVVRESPGYKDLWRTLFSAIRWSGVAAVAALLALALDRQGSPSFWIMHVVLILTLLVVARLWRCVWVLEETIKLAAKRPKGGGAGAQGNDAARAKSATS